MEFSYENLEKLIANSPKRLDNLSSHDLNYISESISYEIETAKDESLCRKWTLMGLKILETFNFIFNESDRAEFAAMHYHSNYLLKWGNPSNNSLLDPMRIVDWVFNDINMPAQKILELSHEWRSLDIDQIRSLRHIKNKLNFCVRLNEKGLFDFSEDQKEYLELQPFLP